MGSKTIIRAATLALLANGIVLVYMCPCSKLLGCHKGPFVVTIGTALMVVAADNYF